MEAKQQNVAVLHHVVPTFGVQAAGLPVEALAAAAQPARSVTIITSAQDKPLVAEFSYVQVEALNRQDFKVRSGVRLAQSTGDDARRHTGSENL